MVRERNSQWMRTNCHDCHGNFGQVTKPIFNCNNLEIQVLIYWLLYLKKKKKFQMLDKIFFKVTCHDAWWIEWNSTVYQISLSAHLCRAPTLLWFLLRFSLLFHPFYSYLNSILQFTLWIILIFLSYPCPYSDIASYDYSPIFVTMTLYSYVSDYCIPYFLRTSI